MKEKHFQYQAIKIVNERFKVASRSHDALCDSMNM